MDGSRLGLGLCLLIVLLATSAAVAAPSDESAKRQAALDALNEGVALQERGDLARSRERLEQARALAPTSTNVRAELTETYYRLGLCDETLAELSAFRELARRQISGFARDKKAAHSEFMLQADRWERECARGLEEKARREAEQQALAKAREVARQEAERILREQAARAAAATPSPPPPRRPRVGLWIGVGVGAAAAAALGLGLGLGLGLEGAPSSDLGNVPVRF